MLTPPLFWSKLNCLEMITAPSSEASGEGWNEEGQTTAYAYDTLNRLKTVDYASDSVIDRTYFYDPEGNILAVTEVPGDATRQTNVAYAYDAAGRLTKECLGATHQATWA